MKQIKTGAILSYVNIILKNLVNIFYTPLLIHLAGQNNFGIYQLTAQTIATLSILSMGFSGAYIHFFWMEKKKGEEFVRRLNGTYLKMFTTIAILSIVIGTLVTIFSPLFFGNTFNSSELKIAKIMLGLMSLNMAVTFISTIFDSFISANQRFVFQQSRILATTIIQPLIVIPLLMIGFSVVTVAMVQLITSIMLLLLNGRFAIVKLNMEFALKEKIGPTAKLIFTFSGFLLINDIVDLINNNLPGMIVGSLLGPASVAVYAIVVQIRNIFFQLSLALSNVFIPKINKMFSESASNDEFSDVMVKVGRVQLLILLFVYGGFIVVGKFFINMWAGSGFQDAYWMLVVTLFPALVPLSQNMGIEIQRAKNMHKFRSLALGVLALVNIIITYYSLKIFGLTGSVFGYVFSLAIGNGLLINLYNHFVVGLDMVKFWKSTIKLVVGSAISIVLGLVLQMFIKVDNVFSFSLVGLIYAGIFYLIWYLWSADANEKMFLKEYIKK